MPPDLVEQVPLDLLDAVTGLAADAERIPWDGPEIRTIEHQAHAPGHAALLIGERGVLVAGDLVSDILIPLLDFNDATDPVTEYHTALGLIESVVGDVEFVVPGHGSVCAAGQARARIEQDRAYVNALRDGVELSDSRMGPHEHQRQQIAHRRDGTPG